MSAVYVVGADGGLGNLLAERLGAGRLTARCSPSGDAPTLSELGRADVVINAAGPRVRPGLAWPDYHREHVGIASAVARAMRRGAHLIHFSSTAVYGARGVRLDAQTPEAPLEFPNPSYASAKLAAEHAVRVIAPSRGVEVTIVRPSMVYGKGLPSALGTVRDWARRRILMRLLPGEVRQHLCHWDLLAEAIAVLVKTGPRPDPLLLADPFLATNADLTDALRKLYRPWVQLPIPLRTARGTLKHWPGFPLHEAPGMLAAFAVLTLDNEFDWETTFRTLDLDPARFARPLTLDAYLGAR